MWNCPWFSWNFTNKIKTKPSNFGFLDDIFRISQHLIIVPLISQLSGLLHLLCNSYPCCSSLSWYTIYTVFQSSTKIDQQIQGKKTHFNFFRHVTISRQFSSRYFKENLLLIPYINISFNSISSPPLNGETIISRYTRNGFSFRIQSIWKKSKRNTDVLTNCVRISSLKEFISVSHKSLRRPQRGYQSDILYWRWDFYR